MLRRITPLARRIVHWLLNRLILKGEMKMSTFNRENKLRILGVMGEETAEIAYCVDGRAHETINAEKLLLTPAKFYLIEKAARSTEPERRHLMNEVIRLGFVIMDKVPTRTLLRSEKLSVIYNVINDRYCLPIPSAVVSELLYAKEEFQLLVKDVNNLITKANLPVENDEKELIPESEKPFADYIMQPVIPAEAYDKNITITAKGLSKEQCDKLVALAVAYTVDNNSKSSTNHSSLTIE